MTGDGLVAVSFFGGSGADSFHYNAVGAANSFVQFDGGTGTDFLAWSGAATSASIHGGDDADHFFVIGSGALDINGAAGDDRYTVINDPSAELTISEPDGSGTDTLDFSAFSGGPLDIHLGITTPQPQSTRFTIQFANGLAMEDILGTPFADNISGNANGNVINGAEFFDGFAGPVATPDGITQWVLLDFDSATDAGEHVYSEQERDAIQQRVESVYRGPDAGAPWFDVRVTLDADQIPVTDFVTITINETPEFGRPGGLASEIDPGNRNLGGTAAVQVNGLLGGVISEADLENDHGHDGEEELKQPGEEPEESHDQNTGLLKPAGTSENFVNLTAKIVAHELGHLLGLRHLDAFGPIGSGLHDPPGVSGFKPSYTGPSGGFETFNHLLGSPASVGSTRFNDLNDLFFGEREALKLAFAFATDADVFTSESPAAHSTIATAQPLSLATLAVPNTLSQGVNAAKDLFFQVQSVEGTIELDQATGQSESDVYSFAGRAGELLNIDVFSNSLARYTNNGNDGFVDTVVRVYDSSGNLVPYFAGVAENDDIFEPTDSSIIDLLLPADDTYFVEVDTFARPANDPLSDPANPDSPLHPSHPANPNNLDTNDPLYQQRLDLFGRFENAVFDTDIGAYQLIVYRFDRANQTDDIDTILGNGGNDIINGGPGDNYDLVATVTDAVSLSEGNSLTETVSILDRPATSWTATVDYGDGSGPQSATVVPLTDPTLTETATLSLDHFYEDDGLFTITISITDDLGRSITETVTASVSNIAPTPTIESISATRQEGTAITFSGSATDPAGANDTLSFEWDFGDGTTATGATATHTYADNGTFTVTLTVSDDDGGTATQTTTINVQNIAPTPTIESISATRQEGTDTRFPGRQLIPPEQTTRSLSNGISVTEQPRQARRQRTPTRTTEPSP